MALSMFSILPVPGHIWEENALNLVLPAFPLVGVIIGLLWYGAALLGRAVELPAMLAAALLTVLPWLLSGFLHLDGYLDTSDALFSRRSFEEKARIIKDPHLGAFAGVMLMILAMLQFASLYVIIDRSKELLSLSFLVIYSRWGGALALLHLPSLPHSSMGKMLQQDTHPRHTWFLGGLIGLTLVVSYQMLSGLALLLATAVGGTFALALSYAYRGMGGGVSGDLIGFALTLSELGGLLVLALS